MSANNAPWGGHPNPNDEYGIQLKPMGLKVHYTFDKNTQDRCLARWPHTLQVQTIPLDERNSIGVVDLRTCLQAVADCSPELANENDKDYTVYAYDYSEPDTPLVGQGMLSSGLAQGADPSGQPKLVTGRVTKNVLAIFGNGVKETLEVRLKLTEVPRVARSNPVIPPIRHQEHFPALNQSVSNLSETNEWNTFIQSNPNFGRSTNVSTVSSPALGPARSFHSNYEARNDFMGPNSHAFPIQPSSRPASVEPAAGERPLSAAPRPASRPTPVSIAPSPYPIEEPANAAPKQAKAQSRPSSRASRRGPTGKPRGRPAKKSQQPDGSTSGVEEGTDADEGPARKKRAKVTQVGRSNSATFGSEPDSLRVAATHAQSIRSFRPVSVGGDVPSGSHLQDIPRAPTPVPDSRQPNYPQVKSKAPSGLRRESLSGQGPDGSFNSSYTEQRRSTSQGLDARSPVDSITPSPSQLYSDEPSPAEMGSSPPVPRSALYSNRSSPMPSSPVLPPMRMPLSQPDSGFMSGGFDDSRIDEDDMGKTPKEIAPPVPVVEKPKPKPRRSRAKKAPAKPPPPPPPPPRQQSQGLIIQEINPGPPELLPRTSIYNPPQASRRGASTPIQQPPSEPPYRPQLQRTVSEATSLEQIPEQPIHEAPQSATVTNRPVPPPVEAVASPRPVEAETKETNKGGNETFPDVTSPQENAIHDSLPQVSQVMSPEEELHQSFADIEKALSGYGGGQNQQYLESLELGHNPNPNPAVDAPSMVESDELPSTSGSNSSKTDQPPPGRVVQETSAEPELPMIPASDPVLPQLTLPFPMSEPPHPETDAADPPEVKANKNFIKRQAIKQKLEEAIAQGEMPTYCRNCAALQTPTWRKIWKQEHRGVPEYHEYSEKAGHVTAINILERDAEGKSTLYEMIKKALGPNDDKSAWTEVLLCNPCGIWFSKWKAHRPSEKWEKDAKRLSQVRKKRANGSGPSRSKKSRTKGDSQMNLTSEAGLPTDPLGPPDSGISPGNALPDPFTNQPDATSEAGSGKDRKRTRVNEKRPGSTHSRTSTHSRGSGTPGSPIMFNDELGPTRRLLFPSPRKEGEQKVLGEVAVNIVQTPSDFGAAKEGENAAGKENSGSAAQSHITANDDFVDLFGTPPARPSTPPPKSAANSGPFKTPTRPTPSHRPITRSVSKSMRSTRSATSPSQALMLDRTPSKTPRSAVRGGALTSSAILRRSPRNNNDAAAVSLLAPHHLLDDHQHIFDSPFTKSLNQLLSEANDFVAPPTPNGSRRGGDGGFHIDLAVADDHFDFGSLLSTDGILPSSPPLPPMLRGGGGASQQHVVHFGGGSLTYEEAEANLWAQLDATATATGGGGGGGSGAADMGHGADTAGNACR